MEVGAASLVGEIWLNGRFVTRHIGGYSAFRADVTDFCHEGETVLNAFIPEAKLRGVCRHQDRLYEGNALSKAEHYEDAQIIADMGANCIRLAHYQQSQDMYDACDQLGLVVWAEIPYFAQSWDNDAQAAGLSSGAERRRFQDAAGRQNGDRLAAYACGAAEDPESAMNFRWAAEISAAPNF